MFQLFADLIGLHLDPQDRLASSEAALLNEREVAELREQFIAVLGHDLRTRSPRSTPAPSCSAERLWTRGRARSSMAFARAPGAWPG
jgi:hypothetical protein